MNTGSFQHNQGGAKRPAIVESPAIVLEGLKQFGELFANAPERQHFAEYLTGLLVAERKTVSGINREFAATTDQSCLNRWRRRFAGRWSGRGRTVGVTRKSRPIWPLHDFAKVQS